MAIGQTILTVRMPSCVKHQHLPPPRNSMPMVQSMYFRVRFSRGNSIHCDVLLRPQCLPRTMAGVDDMETAILSGEENTLGIEALSVKKLADFFVKGVILAGKRAAAWYGAQGFHRIDQPVIPRRHGLRSLGGACTGRS